MRSLASLAVRLRAASPLPVLGGAAGASGRFTRRRQEGGAEEGQGRGAVRDAAHPAREAPPAAGAPRDPVLPMPGAEHRAVVAGFLAAGLQRPPAWSDPASVPPPGAWCGRCRGFGGTGGRWWREAVEPAGWRCGTCHPPANLTPGEVVERRT